MKQCWSDSELAESWTLSDDEKQLSDQRTQQGRLGLAVLLKFFQVEGRFPHYPVIRVDYQATEGNLFGLDSGTLFETCYSSLEDAQRLEQLIEAAVHLVESTVVLRLHLVESTIALRLDGVETAVVLDLYGVDTAAHGVKAPTDLSEHYDDRHQQTHHS